MLRPRGPTETTIRTGLAQDFLGQGPKKDTKTKQPDLPAPLRLGGGVGQNQANRPQDVIGMKNALTWTGHYPLDKAHKADPTPDDDLIWGLSGFQRDFGLNRDAFSHPGGETEAKINQLITPLIQASTAASTLQIPAQSTAWQTMALKADNDADKNQIRKEAAAASLFSAVAEGGTFQLAQANPSPGGKAPLSSAPQPIPSIPHYTTPNGGMVTRVDPQDWKDFHTAMDNLGVMPLERSVFGRIYSAEGGAKPDGTTVAGITNKIISDIFTIGKDWQRDRMKAAGITKNMVPAQLTTEQRVQVYQLYLDEVVGPAKASKGKIGGMDVLNNKIGDPDTIAAVADTLIRMGGPAGTKLIQQAINKTYSDMGSQQSVQDDGDLGSQTLDQIGNLAADPMSRKQLVDNLMDGRVQYYSGNPGTIGETSRADSYRLP